jgi:transposase
LLKGSLQNYHFLKNTKKLNFKDTSLDLGISTTTVMRYFNKETDFKITGLESPKVIHIDEFKGTSDDGKYQVALCDGDTNKPYDVS